MRICYVAADVVIPYFRGGSIHTYEVAKNLTRLGHEVHVVSRRIDFNQKKHEKLDNFYVHRIYREIFFSLPFIGHQRAQAKKTSISKTLRERLYTWYLFTFYALFIGIIASRIIAKYNLDIVVERETSFGGGAIAAIITKRPMVLEVIGPRYSKLSMRKAKKIMLYTTSFLRENVPAEKLEIVTAGVDVETFNPQLDEGAYLRKKYNLESLPVVGYVGTFAKWHGVEDLISASEKVLKGNPTVRFLMVGPYFEHAREFVNKLGLSDAFIFTGPVPYTAIPKYMNAVNVLVAPFNPARSKLTKQGFIFSPLKIFEYMACGKPVVTTSVELVTDVVENGKTGILVSPGKPEALAESILLLIKDPLKCEKLGKAARELVEKKYSWKAFALRLEKILEEAES